MTGSVEDVVRSSSLADTAAVHDNNLVAHGRDDTEVVRNKNDRHAELLLQIFHQLENLRLNCNVERGCRFVRNQDIRLAGKRHRDHDTLPHAAGELERILLDPAFRLIDADHLEQLYRASVRGGS